MTSPPKDSRYEGSYPFGTEVTTVSSAGGTYYVVATYEGTPPVGDVEFLYGMHDPYTVNWADTSWPVSLGSAPINGNAAVVSWNTGGLAPDTHYLIYVLQGDNTEWILAYPISVGEGDQ